MEELGETEKKILSVFDHHRLLSIIFGGLCVLCWSYYNVLCDLVSQHFDNFFILFGAIIVNTVFVSPILKFTHKNLNIQGPKQWVSVFCFGFFDVFLIILMSYAFQHAPIGDAACLFAMRVLWTPIVEAFVNKKCITLSHGLTMLFAVAGAILITQPTFLGFPESDDKGNWSHLMLAYLLALIAGIIAGLQYIFLHICPDVHWSVWQVMIVPAGLIIAPFVFFFGGSYKTVSMENITQFFIVDLVACFLIAWFDILGRLCRTVACKEHTPSTVSLISVLEIPFTYGWGWIYAGQAMKGLQIGGACLIMVAVVMVSAPSCKSFNFRRFKEFMESSRYGGRPDGQSRKVLISEETSGYGSVRNVEYTRTKVFFRETV